jgi:replication factor C small subunit
MVNTKEHSLFVEKYRPSKLENYVGNEHLKTTISRYLEQNDIQNLIFYGQAGGGKTTLAKLIVGNLDCDYLYINASDERGIETIRDKVSGFASVASFKPIKVVILDEADFLTIQAQASLRNVIETFSRTTRFIMTCNFVERIIDPLQSRCHIILIEPSTGADVYTEILRREGFPKDTYSNDAYTELIMLSLCSIMKFQSLVKMLYSLKLTEGWDFLTLDYIKKSFDPHIWGSMRELLNNLMNSKWEEAQKQMYKIWELGYSFEDILFELEHNIIAMNIIDHRAWYNVQQFLIKSWIYHSQSRSSILDLMTACNEVKPWTLEAP